MNNLYRIKLTLALCVSFVVLFLASGLYWEHLTKYGMDLRVSAYWNPPNSKHEEGGHKASEKTLSRRSDIVCSSRSYKLQTSEPLDVAIGQLNRLLACVATEIVALPTSLDGSTQVHGINHASVMRCFEGKPGVHSACKLHDVNNNRSTPNVGTLTRNVTVRRAVEYKLDEYFRITRSEPLVFDLMLSWRPFQRSDWQQDWPFRDAMYYLQMPNHTCKLNGTKFRSANLTGMNNVSVPRIPHQEETKLNGLPGECKDNLLLDHPKPITEPEHLYKHPIYVHIIRQGTVSGKGTVRVGLTEIIPSQCKVDNAHAPGKASKHYKHIFVISQRWGIQFFHANIETLPRLMPYLEFLKQHPEIKIHAPARFLARNFALLGLKRKRMISGLVKADVIYLPQGTPCGKFHSIAGRLLHREYARYIQNHVQDFDIKQHVAQPPPLKQASQLRLPEQNITAGQNKLPSANLKENLVQTPDLNLTSPLSLSSLTYRNITVKEFHHPASIILIKRSKKRWLAQQEEVKSLLEWLAREKNLNFEVFADNPLPSFSHTVSMFSQAKLVVAPHGAGLTNLLFSPTGTRVVEILCNPRPNLCLGNIHATLGQPYVGLLSLIPLKKCGPLYVDLKYLKLVVLSLLDK